MQLNGRQAVIKLWHPGVPSRYATVSWDPIAEATSPDSLSSAVERECVQYAKDRGLRAYRSAASPMAKIDWSEMVPSDDTLMECPGAAKYVAIPYRPLSQGGFESYQKELLQKLPGTMAGRMRALLAEAKFESLDANLEFLDGFLKAFSPLFKEKLSQILRIMEGTLRIAEKAPRPMDRGESDAREAAIRAAQGLVREFKAITGEDTNADSVRSTGGDSGTTGG